MSFPSIDYLSSSSPSIWDLSSSHWGSGGSSLTQKGSSGMWPLALASFGSALVTGALGGMAADNQARTSIALSREANQAQKDAAFANLLAGQYAQTNDYQQQAERRAKEYQQFFLDPRASQLAQQDIFRGIQTELSPQAKKLRQQKNLDQLSSSISEKTAMMDKVFGFVPTDKIKYGAPDYTSIA